MASREHINSVNTFHTDVIRMYTKAIRHNYQQSAMLMNRERMQAHRASISVSRNCPL